MAEEILLEEVTETSAELKERYAIQELRRRYKMQLVGDIMTAGVSYMTSIVVYLVLATVGVFVLWALNVGLGLLLEVWGMR